MNTKFSYLYRDASNYKQSQSVVVEGELSKEQIEQIYEACDGEYFIPAQVGLPEIRFDEITEDDHCWFEIGDIELTEEEPTELNTAEEVFKSFMETKEKGWDDVSYAPSIADNERDY